MPLPDFNVPSKIVYRHEDGTEEIYIRQEEIGRGGFSIVYRVKTQETNKIYAMKVISKKFAISKNKMALTELKNEIKIQESIKHPNIVRLEASFSDDTFYYIVLEFCPGMSIRRYLQKSPKGYLSESETRKILRDVVRGLTYLHSSNIIHHDIKLENFIIGIKGRVKIADFGFAILLENDDEKQFSVAGTTNYLSPEIIRREGHSYDADIWAIGVAAFTMLTGKAPFSAKSKVDTYEKILDCDFQFPSNIILSDDAEDFINSILQIDLNKRPTAFDLYNHPFLTKIDDEKVELYNPLKAVQERLKLSRKLQSSVNPPTLIQPTEITEQEKALQTSEKIERSLSSQSSQKVELSKSSQKIDITKSTQKIESLASSSQENQRSKSSQSSNKIELKSSQKVDQLTATSQNDKRSKSSQSSKKTNEKEKASKKTNEKEKASKSHHKEKSSQKVEINKANKKLKKTAQKEELTKEPQSSLNDESKSQNSQKDDMEKPAKSPNKKETKTQLIEISQKEETTENSHKNKSPKKSSDIERTKSSQKEESKEIKEPQKETTRSSRSDKQPLIKSTKFSEKIEKMKSSQFSRKNAPYIFAQFSLNQEAAKVQIEDENTNLTQKYEKTRYSAEKVDSLKSRKSKKI